MMDLVRGRWRDFPFPLFVLQNLIEKELAASVTGITHPAGDPGEPHFKRGADAVWKDHCCLKAPAFDCARNAPRVKKAAECPQQPTTAHWREWNHGVDFGDGFPHIGELCGGEDRDARIRPSAFDRADGRHGHDGVAEPVRRSDENAKWLEFSARRAGFLLGGIGE